MISPVSIPPQHPSTLDHRARYISALRRGAPGGGPRSTGPTHRGAAQGRTANQNMTLGTVPGRTPQTADQGVARIDGAGIRARLVRVAGAVHLPSGNARQTNVRTFRAPDWAVAIPDPDRSAGECLTRRDNCCREENEVDHRPPTHTLRHRHPCRDAVHNPDRHVALARHQQPLPPRNSGRRRCGPNEVLPAASEDDRSRPHGNGNHRSCGCCGSLAH